MSRARAIFFSGVFVLSAAGPAAALACHPPAPWLEALHTRGRDSCCRDGDRALRSAGAPAFVALPAVGPAPLTVTTVERQDAEGRVHEIAGSGFAADMDGVWRLFFQ